MDIPTHFHGFHVGRKHLRPTHLFAFTASFPGHKSDGVGDLGLAITFDNSVFTKPAGGKTSRHWTAYDGRKRVLDLRRYRVSHALRSEVSMLVKADGLVCLGADETGQPCLMHRFYSCGQDWRLMFRFSPIEGLEGVKLAVINIEADDGDQRGADMRMLSYFATKCVREGRQIP